MEDGDTMDLRIRLPHACTTLPTIFTPQNDDDLANARWAVWSFAGFTVVPAGEGQPSDWLQLALTGLVVYSQAPASESQSQTPQLCIS